MMELAVELKRPSELTAAESGAWREFVKNDPALRSPYFALDFAECCEEAREDTRVIIARRKGRICGFLPLHTGKFGYARPLGGPLGDVQGVIAEPGEDLPLEALMRGAGLPIFDFHSALLSQSSFRDLPVTRDGSWIMDMSQGYEAWVESRRTVAPRVIKDIRTKRRRLEAAEGGFVFVMADGRPEAVDLMYQWKREQYHRTGVFDVFSVDWTRKLVSAILKRQSDTFSGLCSTLYVNNEIIGVHVGMASDRLCHYWFPSFNSDFGRLSPGVLLLDEMARTAAAIGHDGVELGPGDFRFKRDLSNYQVGLCSGRLMLPSMLAATCRAATAAAHGIESIPIGAVSQLPGKAMRKLDRLAGFYAA